MTADHVPIAWREHPEEALPLLPAAAEAALRLPATDVSVVCTQATYEALAVYFAEQQRLERLALLLGTVWQRSGNGALVSSITGYWSIPTAESSAVHVRMAARDWPAVWAGIEGRQIIGWAHSHPGHGVRPSATDFDMQRRWFTQPWAVAMIFDPCAGTMAAYAGKACTPVDLVTLAALTALLL